MKKRQMVSVFHHTSVNAITLFYKQKFSWVRFNDCLKLENIENVKILHSTISDKRYGIMVKHQKPIVTVVILQMANGLQN